MTEPSPPSKEPKPLPSAAAFLGMGLTAAVCAGIGLVLGLWVDSALHTSPIFLLVGLALGLVTAVAFVVSQIREYL
jgi:F0F1-type ATP synthase assembly protein I